MPIIPVFLSEGGYDFAEGKKFLQGPKARLELANPGAMATLNKLLEARGYRSSRCRRPCCTRCPR